MKKGPFLWKKVVFWTIKLSKLVPFLKKGPWDGTFFCFKKVLLSMKSGTSISQKKVPFFSTKNPKLKKVPIVLTKYIQKKPSYQGTLNKWEHIILAWREGPFLWKKIPLSEKGPWKGIFFCFKKVLLSMKSETSISTEKEQHN